MVEPIVKWSDVEELFDEFWRGDLCASDLYDALKQRRIDVCPTCRGEQQIGESWGKLRDCPDCDDGWVRRG